MGVLALVLGILVATDVVALWHVFVLAGGLGAVAAIDAPVRQSFVSEMVGPGAARPTPSASTRRSSTAPGWSGPSVAGLLIARGRRGTPRRPSSSTRPASPSPSRRWPACAPTSCGRAPRSPGRRASCGRGCAYTWAHPDLVLAMVLAFVVGTFGFNYQVTIALMARERVRPRAPRRSGCSSTCFAVGSLSGALLSTRRSVRPRQRLPRRSRRWSSACSPSSPG